MQSVALSNKQARRFLLSHQGLLTPAAFAGKDGILEWIRRVGCVQYDPLNIVGRNAELVLQSRIPGFRPSMLQELLYQDRLLLDGWDKVMSIYSLEDWPYFERFRQKSYRQFYENETIRQALPEVRSEIEARGPLSSGDLDLDQTIDWSWAPTRLARAVLESMYFWGELIVHHKKNNQKIYDFAARHIPERLLKAEEPFPSDEEHLDWRVQRRIGAVGFMWEKAGDAWIGMQLKSKERQASFARLMQDDRIVQIAVEGVPVPLYVRISDYDRLLAAKAEPDTSTADRASIIAPLDNLLWDRRLIKQIFDFDYIWEVYKPVSQRQYGYYVLPILHGDTFVARFEPGRDKTTGALVVKNWWWEPNVERTESLLSELSRCFNDFMGFLGTDALLIDPEVVQREGLDALMR